MNLNSLLTDTGVSIFLFHGVIENHKNNIRNYTRKHIDSETFRKYLLELKKNGVPKSIIDVVRHHTEKIPYEARSFVVTFDDGFENNLSVAAPILEELNIPAVFYVTSSFIDENKMSWTDRLELLFEKKESLEFPVFWQSLPVRAKTAKEKIELLNIIRTQVKSTKDVVPDQFVDSVYHTTGANNVNSSDDPLDLKMNWAQVKELGSSDLFTIGGHSHSHRIMSFLSPDELVSEVDTSLKLLKDKAGIITHHYSYPEGLAHCYNTEVIETLKARGILCAPTAVEGINKLDTDLFHLRRFWVS